MEKWEQEKDAQGNLLRETIAIAAPASAVKMLKRNLSTAEEAFSGQDINSNNITNLDANYMRLQQVNPSNKIEMTDPTQIKALITSEQKDSEKVYIGDKEMTVGEIRKAYHNSVSNRITLQYKGRRNLTFTLPSAMDELHKSIELGEVSTDLRSFLRYALINLEASQVKSQMLEFFSTDLTGEPKYDLNNPITIQKFQELFLSYFSKGILREKVPGHTFALVSGKGAKIIKKVISIDEETGQPNRWEVVRTDKWINMANKPTLAKEDYDNIENKTFVGLKPGDYYVDSLRANVQEFDTKGKPTGQTYSEFMVPPHFREVMEEIMESPLATFKSPQEIFTEWYNWATTAQWSPEAQKNIVRSEIPGFDPIRSRMEFADWKGYPYDYVGDKFESIGNKQGQEIPDVVAKMFGVRIPSQDKHSAINLKLVDFMPVYYGSSAVFPEDLIEISGADFDIDKLYTQIKEFYNVGKKFHEYGKAKTEEGQYADYVRYISEQAGQEGNVISDALEAWNEQKPGNIGEQTGFIDNYFSEEKIEQLLGPKPAIGSPEELHYNSNYNKLVLYSMMRFAKESDKSITRLWKTKKNKDLIGAMETLHLPITKKEYLDYKKKHNSEPYVGALNNEILDYKFALLGNKGMTEAADGRRIGVAFEPADLTPLFDQESEDPGIGVGVWNYIEQHVPELVEAVREEGVDVDNLLGKLKAWTNNKEGARSIGAVVLPNVVMNILAENNATIRSKKVDGIETIPQIRLNGHSFKNFNTQYEVDPKTGKQNKQGFRTQYVISALVTAMTDNAKERLAAKLGLNKDALALVTNLTALGVPIRTSVLLVNQPAIKTAYFQAINKDQPTDPGVKTILKKLVRAMEQSYESEELYTVNVNDAALVDAIKRGVGKEHDVLEMAPEDARFIYSSMKQFINAHDLKETTGNMQALVTLSNGFGRDTESIDARNESINELGMELNDKEFAKTSIPVDSRPIFNEEYGAKTYQARYYTIYKEFTEQLLPAAFFTRTPDFQRIKQVVLDNMTGDDFYMTPYRKAQIEKDLLSYISIKAYMRALTRQGNELLKTSLQNGFIYDYGVDQGALKLNDVVDRVKKYLDETKKSNFFIDNYVYQDRGTNETNNSGINRLKSNTWTRLSDSQVVKLQNSFLELYSDLNTRQDAIHLAHYVLVKDAMQYRAGTILDAIPPYMFDNLLQSIKSAHNAFNLSTKTPGAFQRVLGASLPEVYNEFAKGYLQSQNNYWLLKNINIGYGQVYDPARLTAVQLVTYGANVRANAIQDENGFYVFADNASESGMIGHQRLRGLPNSQGIAYKLKPGYAKSDYFSDDTLSENIEIIDENIAAIQELSETEGKNVVFPANFLSSTDKGRTEEIARMKKYGPETFAYLSTALKEQFGYDINSALTKKLKSTRDALKKPLYINEETKTLNVDIYKGIVDYVDRESGARKMKNRWSGKKGKGGEKIPAWKQALASYDKLKKNISFVRKKGFDSYKVDVIEGRRVMQIGFPLRVKINRGSIQQPKWVQYELQSLWSDGAKQTSDFAEMIEDGETLAYGNRAEYVESEGLGSYGQNPIGFVYGERPEYAEVQSYVDNKPVPGLARALNSVEDADYMDKLTRGAEQEAVAQAVAQASKVEYDGSNIQLTNDKKQKFNISDLQKIADASSQAQDQSEKEETSVVDDVVDEETKQEQDFASAIASIEGAPERAQVVNIESLKKQLKSDEPTYDKINDFWSELSRDDRNKIRTSLKVESVNGLIDEFIAENNTFTEDEFIEDLKKCYL